MLYSEREMTLQEWCNRLSDLHLVNKELRIVRKAMHRLLKWIDYHAEYGIESDKDLDTIVGEALDILGDDVPIR